MKQFHYVFLVFVMLNALVARADDHLASNTLYIENKGQWTSPVLFKAPIASGNLYLEENTFTYVYYHSGDLDKAHDQEKAGNKMKVRCHAYKVHLSGAAKPVVTGQQSNPERYNYFLGN